MSAYNYPHTGYGVEAHTDSTGWVLLDGIRRTHAAATETMHKLTGQYGFGADDLRVVTLTITRDEHEGDKA